jgi:GTPase
MAKNGKPGRGKHCYGRHAEDLIVKVPVGTVVKQLSIETLSSPCSLSDMTMVQDLIHVGDSVVVARGARGGMGNVHFANSIDRTPKRCTPGEKGESKILSLELKTIADVGLVGLPNAGKSTFLAAVSNAHPKIAPYPFTTLNPYVGTIDYRDYYQVTVADIPGLIPGAHLNIGLGHQFLRHIERAKMLVYILDLCCEDDLLPTSKTHQPISDDIGQSIYPRSSEKRTPYGDLCCLQKELEFYHSGMTSRPSLIVANKIDLGKKAEHHLEGLKKQTSIPIIPISAKNMLHIEEVTSYIRKAIESLKSAD